MTYIKLFLTASLVLLFTHCGKKTKKAVTDAVDAVAKEISIQDLSPALQRAHCLSGVYTASADLDNSLVGSLMTAVLPDDKFQISIAHNKNNDDAKVIVLLEELAEESSDDSATKDTEATGDTAANTPAGVCSILSGIQYNQGTEGVSTVSASNVRNIGSLYTVAGIDHQIKFKESGGSVADTADAGGETADATAVAGSETADAGSEATESGTATADAADSGEVSCDPVKVGFITLQTAQGTKQDSTGFVKKQDDPEASYEALEQKCLALATQENKETEDQQGDAAEEGDDETPAQDGGETTKDDTTPAVT